VIVWGAGFVRRKRFGPGPHSAYRLSMAKEKPTRESIVNAWKKLDAKSSKPVGVSQVSREMGISPHWFWKLFAGESLTDMKRQHGIRLSPQETHRSTDDLLSQLDSVVSKRRQMPAWNVLINETGISENTWKKNLGGREGCSQEDVYRTYEKWLQANRPESPNLELVTAHFQGPAAAQSPATNAPSASRGSPAYQKTDARVFGRRLHFRNLAYEPTNEQGVVFLFGMVSQELGFESIEYLGIDFPDCEGKWKVRGRQQLQHVRIEFEFKSSNYDHDPSGCDVIVCWEHNWKECPASLKVIELKKEIKALRATPET
jgi:hypothetical protein